MHEAVLIDLEPSKPFGTGPSEIVDVFAWVAMRIGYVSRGIWNCHKYSTGAQNANSAFSDLEKYIIWPST